MSKHETPMTLWYWEQLGGTLYEEFPVVRAGPGRSRRNLDAVIVLGGERRRMPARSTTSLDEHDIVIVHAKRGRLGMNLMGQVLFSRDLVLRTSKPRSLRSVALCRATDVELQPLLEQHNGCEVVVCPYPAK